MNQHIHQIAISLIPGIGHLNAKKLIAYCGSETAIFKEKASALRKVPGIGELMAKKVIAGRNKALEQAKVEYENCIKNNIDIHFFLEEGYPKRLFHCEDGPIILYTKGKLNLNPERSLSIVGTRHATLKGKAICEKIVEELKSYDVTIISGLAYGIDITAHKAALKYDIPTQAVLASGLDTIYPKTHLKYSEKLQKNGGIISDYVQGTSLRPSNFVERNRIIAGMSDAVVVIESSSKGGSLITADFANGYHRDVFAIPGRIDDSQSIGCNRLIKTNKAALIESAKDIAYLLGWQKESVSKPVQRQLFVDLDQNEKHLFQILEEHRKMGIDEISVKSGMPMSKTTSLLLNLEFKGVIKSLPGKTYQIIH